MSKGIIVVDIPETCGECICCMSNPMEDYCLADEDERFVKWVNSPPEWCPIKPMPERDDTDLTKDIYYELVMEYQRGWNACIDEILGGSE